MMSYARACQQLGNFALHPLIHASALNGSSTKCGSGLLRGIVWIKVCNSHSKGPVCILYLENYGFVGRALTVALSMVVTLPSANLSFVAFPPRS